MGVDSVRAEERVVMGRPSVWTALCVLALCLPGTIAAAAGDGAGRRGPVAVYAEPDRDTLLLLCEKSGTIVRFDPTTGGIVEEVALGESPTALAFHPDGRRVYVSCRRSQEIVEVERATLQPVRRFRAPGDPRGLAVSADGERLYAAMHSLDQVAVLAVRTGGELKRLAAGRGPEDMQLSPRDGRVYVTNVLSNPGPSDQPCRNEVTVIDDASARVVDRTTLVNANIGRRVAVTHDGRLAVVAVSRPKNLVPMLQVARGWVVSNGFALVFADGAHAPVQLLVDQPNRAYSDPYAVAVTPDDRTLYLSCAGADMVIAIDVAAVRRVVDEVRAGKIPQPADHLGLSRRYVTARIPVGANPQALAVGRDGSRLYVANRLDDSITTIDTARNTVVATQALGNPGPVDQLLYGERLFHSSARTFQGQFCCVSCHPEGGVDGLQYDLEPDGIGENILDNRNLRAVRGTAPYKWVGSNPDIATQCGTRTAKWIVRTGWLSSAEVVALTAYINSIPAAYNPYAGMDHALTPAQQRGKAFFERTTMNDGTPLPELQQCHVCHSGPHFTNFQKFDVGTRAPTDRSGEFDTAHLTNIFESAPYLHDGRAPTLEAIWTEHNPSGRHGISIDWTKQQLNDLVEYLKAIGSPEAYQ